MHKVRHFLLLIGLLACGCGKGSTSHWLEQLKASEPLRRIEAVHTLQERKEDADQVVPALTEALQDENTYVRRDAARALGSFGAAANSAIPALRAARRDREPSVRKAADIALSRIDPTFSPPSRPVRR